MSIKFGYEKTRKKEQRVGLAFGSVVDGNRLL
jgi:hypothetical protein